LRSPDLGTDYKASETDKAVAERRSINDQLIVLLESALKTESLPKEPELKGGEEKHEYFYKTSN